MSRLRVQRVLEYGGVRVQCLDFRGLKIRVRLKETSNPHEGYDRLRCAPMAASFQVNHWRW